MIVHISVGSVLLFWPFDTPNRFLRPDSSDSIFPCFHQTHKRGEFQLEFTITSHLNKTENYLDLQSCLTALLFLLGCFHEPLPTLSVLLPLQALFPAASMESRVASFPLNSNYHLSYLSSGELFAWYSLVLPFMRGMSFVEQIDGRWRVVIVPSPSLNGLFAMLLDSLYLAQSLESTIVPFV